MGFSEVVEAIKSLSFEEKQEIQTLLTQYLREEGRDELYENYQKSLIEEQNGDLKFSSNINELKQLIEE
ncbi:MAG: hypothetical protein ACRC8K_24335 [Waterburya sp.]